MMFFAYYDDHKCVLESETIICNLM